MKFLSIILASILIASLVGLSNFDDAFADHMYRGGYVEHTSTTFEGFVIDYRNYGVEIKNIQADVDEKKLTVTIYTTANPAFVEIDVPRELLDAITDGVDQSFTVIYEGEVSNFEQVQTTDTYRTLNIPVGTKPPNHTSENQELQIIGTNIFGEVELPTDVWGKITRLYQQRYPYNDLLHIDAESNVIRDALCEKTFGEDGKKYYETSFSTDLQGTSTKFNAGQLHEIPYQKLRVELYTNNCVHLLDTEYFVWQGFPGDEPEPTPEPTPEPEPEPTPEPEPAPEPEPTLIFVYTDKSAYKHGEQIKIYGSVENIRTGILVTVTVISPTNNIVRIDQVSVNNYGEFSTEYSTSGDLWKYDGTYTIRVQYGNQAVSNKTLVELTGGLAPSFKKPEHEPTKVSVTVNVQPFYAYPGDSVRIFGSASGLDSFSRIRLSISDPNGNTLLSESTSTDYNGRFITTIILPRHLTLPGKYTVTADVGVAVSSSTTASFELRVRDVPQMTGPTTVEVSMPTGTSVPGCEETNRCFNPATVSVDVGGTVTWSNDDTAAHTVTSGTSADGPNGIFDSSLFMAGTTFSHTFDDAGTYDYFCMVHPWMIGEVVVDGSSTPPTRSPPTPTPTTQPKVEAPPAAMGPFTGTISLPEGSGVPGCEATNECYIPSQVTINAGETVTWSNDDTAAHTVTSGTSSDGPDGIFDSSLFMAGTTFEHTFDEDGTYDYFCMVHPWMVGTVIVGEGGPVTPIPTPTPPPPTPIPAPTPPPTQNDDLSEIIEENKKLREELERQGEQIDELSQEVDWLKQIIQSIQNFFGSIFG